MKRRQVLDGLTFNLDLWYCGFNKKKYDQTMKNNAVNPKIYKMFGVIDYVNKLTREKKSEDLAKLDKTISKFILAKGLEDLSEDKRKKLQIESIEDGMDLYKFFNTHIDNFQKRLKDYGRDFKNTILNI